VEKIYGSGGNDGKVEKQGKQARKREGKIMVEGKNWESRRVSYKGDNEVSREWLFGLNMVKFTIKTNESTGLKDIGIKKRYYADHHIGQYGLKDGEILKNVGDNINVVKDIIEKTISTVREKEKEGQVELINGEISLYFLKNCLESEALSRGKDNIKEMKCVKMVKGKEYLKDENVSILSEQFFKMGNDEINAAKKTYLISNEDGKQKYVLTFGFDKETYNCFFDEDFTKSSAGIFLYQYTKSVKNEREEKRRKEMWAKRVKKPEYRNKKVGYGIYR